MTLAIIGLCNEDNEPDHCGYVQPTSAWINPVGASTCPLGKIAKIPMLAFLALELQPSVLPAIGVALVSVVSLCVLTAIVLLLLGWVPAMGAVTWREVINQLEEVPSIQAAVEYWVNNTAGLDAEKKRELTCKLRRSFASIPVGPQIAADDEPERPSEFSFIVAGTPFPSSYLMPVYFSLGLNIRQAPSHVEVFVDQDKCLVRTGQPEQETIQIWPMPANS